MYLNLFSIIERSGFNIRNAFCRDPEAFDIYSICSLSKNNMQPPSHSLCIADSSILPEILKLPIHVISNTPIDIDDDDSSFLSYSYVNDVDLDALGAELQDIMIHYYGRISDTQSAIINQLGLQEVLNIASGLLRNPVALFDNNQNMLCHSASDETVRQFGLWDYALSHGYSPELSDENSLLQLFRDKRTPFYFRSTDDNEDTLRMITPVYYNSYLFGCLGSVNNTESFTHCDYADSCVVQSLIEQALRTGKEFDLNVEKAPWYIIQALRGKELNANVADYNLRRIGHGINDSYRVLTFQLLSGETDRVLTEINDIISDIAFIFSNALTYGYNNQIIVIDYDTSRFSDKAFTSRLSRVMRRCSLSCGISMFFDEFMSLHRAFMQSLIAVRYADIGHVEYFNSNITSFIMDSLRKENEHDGFLYPGIDSLLRKDPEYGKELLRCLEAFILNGCNQAATAKALYLHRNTVIYRLDQIRSQFPIDFDKLTAEDRILIILSCEKYLHD